MISQNTGRSRNEIQQEEQILKLQSRVAELEADLSGLRAALAEKQKSLIVAYTVALEMIDSKLVISMAELDSLVDLATNI